jgi:hypothetical protein
MRDADRSEASEAEASHVPYKDLSPTVSSPITAMTLYYYYSYLKQLNHIVPICLFLITLLLSVAPQIAHISGSISCCFPITSDTSKVPGRQFIIDLPGQPFNIRSKGRVSFDLFLSFSPPSSPPYRLAPLHRPSNFIPNGSQLPL